MLSGVIGADCICPLWTAEPSSLVDKFNCVYYATNVFRELVDVKYTCHVESPKGRVDVRSLELS